MAQAQPLLERDAELEQLDRAIVDSLTGRGGLVVLEGPAGIGKTALLGEAQRRAEDAGMAILSARAAALERDFGFGVVRQLFESQLASAPLEERAHLFAGAAALAAPIVASGEDDIGMHLQQASVVHGLYWLTANLAELGPVMISVDDVHWADGPSVAFLIYLARRLEGLPVLVAVTLRTGDPQPQDSIVGELVVGDAVHTVRPNALSVDAVASMITDRLGSADPDFVAACHTATGGVPFLVHELVGALHADRIAPTAVAASRVGEIAPTTVAHATALRLSGTSANAVAVARAVAILGPHGRLDRVAELAGVDESSVVAAEDALVDMDILSAGSPVGFVHPLVHRAVYDDIPANQRADAHRQAARLLAAEPAPLDAVAAHLLLSPPAGDDETVALLREAAANAGRNGAPGSAVAYMRRAADEGAASAERAELLYELGLAETLISHPRALGDLQDAFALERDPVARGKIAFAIAYLWGHLADWDATDRWLEIAIEEAGDLDLDLACRCEAARASQEAYHPRTADAFESRLPRLRELLDAPVPGARNLAIRLATVIGNRWDDQHEVVPLVVRGLDDGRFVQDEGAESLDLSQGMGALLARDELDLAESTAAATFQDARRRGSPMGYGIASWYRGFTLVQRGRLEEAEADYRAALGMCVEHGWMLGIPTFLALGGVDVLLQRPGLADLADLAETTVLEDPVWAGSANGALFYAARGRLRISHGRRDEGIADLRAAGAVYEPARLRNPVLWLWRSPLALALPPEDVDEARALVEGELRTARAMGLPRAEGVALRALGLLDGGTRGLDLLEESLCALDPCPSIYERAHTTVELGAALRRLDRRSAARDRLREGLELAQRSGALRLEERALEELRIAGGRPRRRDMSGLESLTPSELRVARLAADGMANREIAQDLFVTAKTVENQLGHVYRKLGVRRDGLARMLGGDESNFGG